MWREEGGRGLSTPPPRHHAPPSHCPLPTACPANCLFQCLFCRLFLKEGGGRGSVHLPCLLLLGRVVVKVCEEGKGEGEERGKGVGEGGGGGRKGVCVCNGEGKGERRREKGKQKAQMSAHMSLPRHHCTPSQPHSQTVLSFSFHVFVSRRRE